MSACCDSAKSQRIQLISLFWQYALLLPFCVRANSSPANIIGVPCEKSRVESKLRIWRSRNVLISLSSVGPSTPQFHDRLSLLPSSLASPFASLCLSL